MSKGSEYISRVIQQVSLDDQQGQGCHQGAFLAAALSIIHVVESPLKEEALVSLVSLFSRQRLDNLDRGRRSAA